MLGKMLQKHEECSCSEASETCDFVGFFVENILLVDMEARTLF